MKTMLYLLGIVLLSAGCGAGEEQKAPPKAADTTSVTPAGNDPISGCYQMIIKEDTATLQIEKRGDSVSGHLTYNNKEKDDNDGIFSGQQLSDSTILVNYTFASEGVRSVRQLVFKIRDSVILQGYGEEHPRHDTAFLRDPKLAVYDSKHPFRRGCD